MRVLHAKQIQRLPTAGYLARGRSIGYHSESWYSNTQEVHRMRGAISNTIVDSVLQQGSRQEPKLIDMNAAQVHVE